MTLRPVLVVSISLLAAAGPRLALAEDPAPAPSPATPPAASPPPVAEPPPAAARPSADALRAAPPAPSPFDFDLLPASPAATATDEAFERSVGRRRTMLTVHQGLGIGMLTALAATTVVGQLDFNDRFRGGGDTGKYHDLHKGLAYGSAAVFATAAAFSLLAPEPYEKKTRSGLDSARLHKITMGVAAAAMVAQVILGATARSEAGTLRERDLATAHQVLGYATLGVATAGAVVLLF